MKRWFYAPGLIGRFQRDRQGNIMVAFCLLSFGLVFSVGAAVDFTLATQFRGALQNAADAAALAGAANLVDAAGFSAHRAVATEFMNASIARLPVNDGVTFEVTPFATVSKGITKAYNIKVAASGRVRTTFLSLVVDFIPVAVVATARNPVAAGNHDEARDDLAESVPAGNGVSAGDAIPKYDRSRNLDMETFGMKLPIVHLVQ